jgi:hypothetical protein
MKKFETNKENLQGALTDFFKWVVKDENYYSSIAKVTSVDDSEKTCDVTIINGPDLTGVRLQQVSSATGLFIKPSVDSIVIIGWTDKTTAYVAMYSQIDEIVFQDGANGGLIKIEDLVIRLNDLVSEVRGLKTSLNAHVHSGGTINGLTGVPSPLLTDTFSDFDRSDFENENFKH